MIKVIKIFVIYKILRVALKLLPFVIIILYICSYY